MHRIKIIALCIAVSFTTFISCGSTYDLYVNSNRRAAQLELKNISIGDHAIAYLEGGKGKTLVLVHGFGAEKDYWDQMAEFLTPSYHVIIPDLPGQAESTKRMDVSYDVEAQAERLHAFIKLISPSEKVSIAGNSMGGNITGIYAAKYPQEVSHLILLDTAGITSPEKSDLTKALEQGFNPLIINSASEFDRLLEYVYAKPPYIPSFLKSYLAERSIANKTANQKVWDDMQKKPAFLQNYLSQLSMPVLIIWGDSDRIINVSCVSVLEKGIKNHSTKILKNCGHGPMMERPKETAGYVKEFISM